MSGQWEVVGKKKTRDVKKPTPPTVAKVPNAPRIDEIFSVSQVKDLYKPKKEVLTEKAKSKPDNAKSKPENASKNKAPKKSQEPAKAKPPKTIESAFSNINPGEFRECYEGMKMKFPDTPLVWLKEMSHFLNKKVPLEISDPTFPSRGEAYPLTVMPPLMQSAIKEAVTAAGNANAQIFFDQSLTALAADMSKNLHSFGHRIFVQYLAMNEPTFATANFRNVALLLKSYQNQRNIGLSILWALGQAGIKDFEAGFQVFSEVMLPLMEMKNYTTFCLRYLISLLKRFKSSRLNENQLFVIFDVYCASYKNYPSDLRQQLEKVLNSMSLHKKVSNEKLHLLIEPLLKRLSTSTSDPTNDMFLPMLMDCLLYNNNSFQIFQQNYAENVPNCAILLKFLDAKWDIYGKGVNQKLLAKTLESCAEMNEDIKLKKKRQDSVKEIAAIIQRLNNRMARQEQQGFSYKMLFVVVFLLGGSLIVYDVRQHGSWEKSYTMNSLKRYNLDGHLSLVVEKLRQGANWLDGAIDKQLPGYYQKTADYLQPYGQLFKDMSLVFYNLYLNIKDAFVMKYPVVINSIDSYIPGLVEKSQQTMESVWSTSLIYYNRSVTYLKTEVFVGQLAPENLQKIVYDAYDVTQEKASECYQWISDKIRSF